jgi:hypothetical protein
MNSAATTRLSSSNVEWSKHLIVGVVAIVIFEGALRKWISSDLTNLCLLLRDTFALLIVVHALNAGKLQSLGLIFNLLALWTALVLSWAMIQMLLLQTSPVVTVIGLRFWLLYLWFSLAAVAILTPIDFIRIKNLLWHSMILMLPIIILQHYSEPGSFVNQLPDTLEEDIFLVSGDLVRVSGTFSFTLGFTCYLALITPIALCRSYWYRPKTYLRGFAWTVLGVGMITVFAILSGSRAALMLFASMLIIWAALSLLGGGVSKSNGSDTLAVFLLLPILITIIYFFNDAVDAITERFYVANQSEDIIERVLTILFGEPYVREQFSFLGYGLGSGTNAAPVLGGQGRGFTLAETEPGRILLEAGLLGLMWQILKVFISLLGIALSLVKFQQTGSSFSLLLWTTTSVAMLTWPSTGQITANALCFILLALAINSLRDI